MTWHGRRPAVVDSLSVQRQGDLSHGKSKEGGTSVMEAYCLKCRTKREMKSPQQVTMKNGKPATKGSCPVCGTQMYRIGKS